MRRIALTLTLVFIIFGTGPLQAQTCDHTDSGVTLHVRVTSSYSCDSTSTADLFCGKGEYGLGEAWLELYHRIYTGWGQISDYRHEWMVGGYLTTSLFYQSFNRELIDAFATGDIREVESGAPIYSAENIASGLCDPPNS